MQGAPLVEVGDDVNASGALLVSCFPSVGFVSSIVAHFMVEKLDLAAELKERSRSKLIHLPLIKR